MWQYDRPGDDLKQGCCYVSGARSASIACTSGRQNFKPSACFVAANLLKKISWHASFLNPMAFWRCNKAWKWPERAAAVCLVSILLPSPSCTLFDRVQVDRHITSLDPPRFASRVVLEPCMLVALSHWLSCSADRFLKPSSPRGKPTGVSRGRLLWLPI